MRHKLIFLLILALVCCEFSEETVQGPPDSSKKNSDNEEVSEAQNKEEIISFDERDVVRIEARDGQPTYIHIDSASEKAKEKITNEKKGKWTVTQISGALLHARTICLMFICVLFSSFCYLKI